MNVAAIIDTAEVVDQAFGMHPAIQTYGLNVDTFGLKSWSHPPCTRQEVKLGHCSPFPEDEYGSRLLTLGYVMTAAVFLPICLMDLKENTSWQIWGCTLLLTLSGYFCYVFSTMDDARRSIIHVPETTHAIDMFDTGNVTLTEVTDDDGYVQINTTFEDLQQEEQAEQEMRRHQHHHHSSLTMWGHQYKSMIGVILFNFALVLAVPAWLHEKKPHVSVHRVVYGSTAVSTLLYVAVGSLAARAIPHANVNMLAPMVSGAFGGGVQAAGSIFAFFIIGLDIPLFSVLTRYNLTNSGMCSPWVANILVVWLPWSLSWLFYQGDVIGDLLDWGGVLLTSAVAFLLPLCLALRVLRSTDYVGSVAVYGQFLTSR